MIARGPDYGSGDYRDAFDVEARRLLNVFAVERVDEKDKMLPTGVCVGRNVRRTSRRSRRSLCVCR